MIEDIKKIAIFKDIEESKLEILFDRLPHMIKSYKEGSFIFTAGLSKPVIAILLDGLASIIHENTHGEVSLIEKIEPYDIFAEVFACIHISTMPVSVQAIQPCNVLFIFMDDLTRVMHLDASQQIISNLLYTLAQKNVALTRRMYYLSFKSIQKKLKAYFHDQKEIHQSCTFSIPYHQTQLATYLCIDRSAMCRELTRMKNDGILLKHKNKYTYLGE